ncbi:MAG: hypothetical protein IPK13_27075 [Deltaproteobacteria bacterium]|nr:hypothetical protein [Deltaproteobacteria bacterium]
MVDAGFSSGAAPPSAPSRFIFIFIFVSGFLPLLGLAAGCRHYHDALGYQARQAALSGDVAAFERLMARAAETMPEFPRDNPKRTVASHFLALGGHDAFMPTIHRWLERGWVSDRMLCAIHRARYRGLATKNPDEALESADTCIARARAAAEDPERSWEVEACLDGAPFLAETSTSALGPMLAQAVDPLAPLSFRSAMLKAMTFRFISDLPTRLVNDPHVERPQAMRDTARDVMAARRRFEAILSMLESISDESLLARATAPAALEIERASQSIGAPFLADYALSETPFQRDLAWAWVRAMKPKKENPRLASLGIWNRRREPLTDAGWFVCLFGHDTYAQDTAGHQDADGHEVRVAAEHASSHRRMLGRMTVRGDLGGAGDPPREEHGPGTGARGVGVGTVIDRCRAQGANEATAKIRVVGPFPLASTADHWREGPEGT